MTSTTHFSPRAIRILRNALPDYELLHLINQAAIHDLPALFDAIYVHELRTAQMLMANPNGAQFLTPLLPGDTAYESLLRAMREWSSGFLETVLEWRNEVVDYASGVAKHEMFRNTLSDKTKRQVLTAIRQRSINAYEPGYTFSALLQADIDFQLLGNIEADLHLRGLLRIFFARHSSGMTPQSSKQWPRAIRTNQSNDRLNIYQKKTPRPNLAFFSRRGNLAHKIMAQPDKNDYPIEIDSAVAYAQYIEFLCANGTLLPSWSQHTQTELYRKQRLLLRGQPEIDALIKTAYAKHGSLFNALLALQEDKKLWIVSPEVTAILHREELLIEIQHSPTLCTPSKFRGMRYVALDVNVDPSLPDIICWMLTGKVRDIFEPGEIYDWNAFLAAHNEIVAQKKSGRALDQARAAIITINKQIAHPPVFRVSPAEQNLSLERAEILRKRKERKYLRKKENEKARLVAKIAEAEALQEHKSVPVSQSLQQEFLLKQRKQQKRLKVLAESARRKKIRKEKIEKGQHHSHDKLQSRAQAAKKEILKPKKMTQKIKPKRASRKVSVSVKEREELRLARRWVRNQRQTRPLPKNEP